MKLLKALWITSVLLTVSVSVFAEDDEVAAAMKDVSQKIKGGEASRKELLIDDNAKAADARVKELAGDQKTTDEMYSLAADILPVIMDKAKGDPAKLDALLKEATMHPEKFYNSLPAETKAKIKATAAQKEAKKP